MGKALLAEMADDAIRVLLGSKPLLQLTPRTKVSLPQLMKDIELIRKLGYATSEEENRQGFFSVGAVVRDVSNKAIAVISGAVPAAIMKPADRATISQQVLEAAQRASRKLGARNISNIGAAMRRKSVAKAR
ncbi:MAG: hypothetical protein IPK23_10525 [Rhizobiales bacterium]|nr:hypothetical protein [Hyphomicrobiales bacterium]